MNANQEAVKKIKESKQYNNYADFIFFLVKGYSKSNFNMFDTGRPINKDGTLGEPFLYFSAQRLRYYYLIRVYTALNDFGIYDVLDILRSVSKYLQLGIDIPDESELVCTDCSSSDINIIRQSLDSCLPERLKFFESACRSVVNGILKKFKKTKKQVLSEDELFELISQTDMYKRKFKQEVSPITKEDKQKYITMERNVLKEVKTQDWYICREMLIKEALSGNGNPFFKREINGCVWLSFESKCAGSYSTDMKNILNALYDLCVTLGIQVVVPAAVEYRPYSYGSEVSPTQANENIDKLAGQMNELIKTLKKALLEECAWYKKNYPGHSDNTIYPYIISKTERYPIEFSKAMKEYPEKERQRKIAEEQKRAAQEQKEKERKEKEKKQKAIKTILSKHALAKKMKYWQQISNQEKEKEKELKEHRKKTIRNVLDKLDNKNKKDMLEEKIKRWSQINRQEKEEEEKEKQERKEKEKENQEKAGKDQEALKKMKKEKEQKEKEEKARKEKERQKEKELEGNKENQTTTTNINNLAKEKENENNNINNLIKQEGNNINKNINNNNNSIKNNINNKEKRNTEKENENIQINNLTNNNPQNDNVDIEHIVNNSKTFADFCNELNKKNVDFNQIDFSKKSLGIWNCCKAFFSILSERLKALFGTKRIDVNCNFWNLVRLKASYELIKSDNNQPQNSDTLNKSQNKSNGCWLSVLIKEAEEKTKKNQVPAKNSEDKNQIDK